MRLVCDTDFFSAFHKIDRIDLIYEVFGVDRIYVTQAVIDELAKAPFFYDFIRKTERFERVVRGIRRGFRSDRGRYYFVLTCLQRDWNTWFE